MVDEQNPYKSPQATGGSDDRSKAKKQRSRFWIVSTHVLTTGLAMPALASLVGAVVVAGGRLHGTQAFLAMLALQAVGYVAGTYYSLSYLRKVTTIRDPLGCTNASVIIFGVLALLGMAVNGLVSGPAGPLRIVALVVFYSVISLAFARITQKGFAQMAADSATTGRGIAHPEEVG